MRLTFFTQHNAWHMFVEWMDNFMTHPHKPCTFLVSNLYSALYLWQALCAEGRERKTPWTGSIIQPCLGNNRVLREQRQQGGRGDWCYRSKPGKASWRRWHWTECWKWMGTCYWQEGVGGGRGSREDGGVCIQVWRSSGWLGAGQKGAASPRPWCGLPATLVSVCLGRVDFAGCWAGGLCPKAGQAGHWVALVLLSFPLPSSLLLTMWSWNDIKSSCLSNFAN